MKKALLIIQLLFVFKLSCISQNSNDLTGNPLQKELRNADLNKSSGDVNQDWQTEAQQYISKSEYFFKIFADKYAAANRKQKIMFTAAGTSLATSPIQFDSDTKNKPWKSSIELINISKRDSPGTISQTPVIVSKKDYLLFKYEGFKIEYLNNEQGLRQNFLIDSKPDGNQKLKVFLKITGDLVPSVFDNRTLVLSDRKTRKEILKYDDLKVWDANHQPLPASMELNNGNELVLVVDDSNAVYPVTVDPLTHSPEWITSADGVLPGLLTNLQLQIDALYGYSVAGVGDVNGDGFDDIAIGAPAAIDIIAGPTTVVGAGAVFVYFGSLTGPSVTPDKVLRGTTAITNALFGFSIAGGNVSGDGRKDIIVGAPGETYTANVSGIPSTASVTAGKVFVFRGEDLSAAGNPAPLLSVYLNGSAFFSRGVLGVLAANISVNALFGFSVAATEDMNGDGLGEVIVGSPGYAAPGLLPLLPVSTGTALVYYSTNLATNTPVQLQAPNAALLGIPLITNGLLFGFSVDGLGDYDQDGNPDVIVGAPAGISLVPPTNLLGGTAYIFKGTGAGVNTAHYANLRATPSLIGTVANLFGYAVRGVRNGAGVRNGSVLVGAPSGSVLSNIVGGLRLKTGSVNVFTSTASAPNPSGVVPVQSFSSPRGNSLLSILAGQNLAVSALFGASIDNMLDVNCDGINDIIVGEPLSTGVGLINTDAVGGAANIFLGKADGTYETTTFWSLLNNTDFPFGINAGSLVGYSVAGAGHVRGASSGVRALVGAPGAALDFSTGVFNLGSTFGTLFSFVAGDNGLGKSYMFGFDDCGLKLNPDVNATWVNVPVPSNVNTNDIVPAGTTYGTPLPNGSNPAGGSITMNADGTYSFSSTNPGVFHYQVPVCVVGQSSPCPSTELKITVLNAGSSVKPPVANTDIATTKAGNPVIINSLQNDKCSNVSCSLNPASVLVIINPTHGIAVVDAGTGNITYTPDPGFTGKDTLTYEVWDNGGPAMNATAIQIITVNATAALNSTNAADDYVYVEQGVTAIGNVKSNDTDPEGDIQTVTAQSATIPATGTLTLNTDGSFSFVPEASFFGPVDFPYLTCDNGTITACARATLHILVNASGPLPVTIANFGVLSQDCDVIVRWNFENQINGDYTEIEQSTDGGSFSAVYKMSFNGASSGYHTAKLTQGNGTWYYRLKITDKDGKFRYSEVKSARVDCDGQEKLQVFPTLLNSNTAVLFNASATKGPAILTLVDVYGRKLIAKPVSILQGNNSMTIDGSPLSSGAYYIRIEGKDWKTETIKVIKQ